MHHFAEKLREKLSNDEMRCERGNLRVVWESFFFLVVKEMRK